MYFIKVKVRCPVMWVSWLRHPVYCIQSIKTVKWLMSPQCFVASAAFILTIPLWQNQLWTITARGVDAQKQLSQGHTENCWQNSKPKSQFEVIISFINRIFFLYCSQSSFVLRIPPCQTGNPQNTTQVHQSRNSLGDPCNFSQEDAVQLLGFKHQPPARPETRTSSSKNWTALRCCSWTEP